MQKIQMENGCSGVHSGLSVLHIYLMIVVLHNQLVFNILIYASTNWTMLIN